MVNNNKQYLIFRNEENTNIPLKQFLITNTIFVFDICTHVCRYQSLSEIKYGTFYSSKKMQQMEPDALAYTWD